MELAGRTGEVVVGPPCPREEEELPGALGKDRAAIRTPECRAVSDKKFLPAVHRPT